MEIIKFKKNKDNTYQVIFDNELSLKLYDDVIVKYNLLVNKHLTDELLKNITDYNDYLYGYYKAIKYIMKKLRSEKEVNTFLEKLEIKKSDREKLLAKLKKDGYINEQNYLRSYINDQINLTLNGPDKITYNLIKLGFSENDIKEYLDDFSDEWSSRIEKLIDKKIKTNSSFGKNKLQTKIINDLINIGYKKYDIIEVLNNKSFNDEIIIVKEVKKAYNRYIKKYPDNVERKVKDYLYKKGFSLDDIERGIREYEEQK